MSTDTARLSTLDTDTATRAATTTGRVLFALPFAVFGLFHLTGAGAMAAAVPAWVPGGGVFWVVLTGIAMIAAAVSLATGKLARVAGPLLALLMLTYILALHLPGLGNPEMAQNAMMSILKDTSLAGGALLAGLYSQR